MNTPSTRFSTRCSWFAIAGCALGLTAFAVPEVHAQITAPRMLSATPGRFATLEEQLINRLRATREDQRGYLRFVVKQVRENKLDPKLVIAIERYAMKRSPQFPFLIFEQALKVEAGKRGVVLPPVQQFVTTAMPGPAS